jgi:hypothetical protein
MKKLTTANNLGLQHNVRYCINSSELTGDLVKRHIEKFVLNIHGLQPITFYNRFQNRLIADMYHV